LGIKLLRRESTTSKLRVKNSLISGITNFPPGIVGRMPAHKPDGANPQGRRAEVVYQTDIVPQIRAYDEVGPGCGEDTVGPQKKRIVKGAVLFFFVIPRRIVLSAFPMYFSGSAEDVFFPF
jgi:hypothetical protein